MPDQWARARRGAGPTDEQDGGHGQGSQHEAAVGLTGDSYSMLGDVLGGPVAGSLWGTVHGAGDSFR